MLNLDGSTVKHGTQNIQNDFHQQLSDSFRVHKIRFRPGLGPGSPTDPLAGLRGHTSRGEGEGRESGKGEKKGEEGKGRDHPPFLHIPGSALNAACNVVRRCGDNFE